MFVETAAAGELRLRLAIVPAHVTAARARLRRVGGIDLAELAAELLGLGLEALARIVPQPRARMARLRPALARTFRPGCSVVPDAEAVMFLTVDLVLARQATL